jgi:hypothetical protein
MSLSSAFPVIPLRDGSLPHAPGRISSNGSRKRPRVQVVVQFEIKALSVWRDDCFPGAPTTLVSTVVP